MSVVRFDNAVKTRSTCTSPYEKELETASTGHMCTYRHATWKGTKTKSKLKAHSYPLFRHVFMFSWKVLSWLSIILSSASHCAREKAHESTESPTVRKMGLLSNRIKAEKLVIFPCFGFIFHLFVWLLF